MAPNFDRLFLVSWSVFVTRLCDPQMTQAAFDVALLIVPPNVVRCTMIATLALVCCLISVPALASSRCDGASSRICTSPSVVGGAWVA